MLEITGVEPKGSGDRYHLRPGYRILSINGRDISDPIDYRFLVSEERISIIFKDASGTRHSLKLRKSPDDDLGLQFGQIRIKRCRNRCIFCFVDQMPAACRSSLYIKDDDYRASFLYGNYITLGNLTEADWNRIFEQRLSPLYVSVHTTDHSLRCFMLGNRHAPDILSNIRRLAAGGIRIHTQIVLCPGINDGQKLLATLRDLSGLFPSVQSIAVVPVGLTSFRKGLTTLRRFTRAEARNVIDVIEAEGRRFKRALGSRLVYPSDEFYVRAGLQVPAPSFYEDFPQIENGVGMVARFREDLRRLRTIRAIRPTQAILVTGESFAPVLRSLLAQMRTVPGLRMRIIAVKNRLFGPSVTVAGLLSGKDIVHALKHRRLGDIVIISASALKDGEDLFLDDMSMRSLEGRLGVPVRAADTMSGVLSIITGKEY